MSAPEPLPSFPQTSRNAHVAAALLGLLALTAAVRMAGIGRPLLGNFATKNVAYAMIARNWAEGRTPIWYPTLDLLRDGRRTLHMVEFPVSAYLSGALWRLLGGSLDVWGRATAVGFSIASVALMFWWIRRRHGPVAATGAAAALALSPVSIIYGQSFMLEASLVFFTLLAFYATDRWLSGAHRAWLAVAGCALALLLLSKIYMLVLLLPLGAMAAAPGVARESKGRTRVAIVGTVFLAVLPAAAWYALAAAVASGAVPGAPPVFYSIRDSAQAHWPPNALLRSADFYRQVLDDLAGVALTPLGFALAIAGLVDRQWRRYAVWLLAMAVLLVAMPRKFYEMNYYWLAVLPPLCILVGLGWQVVHDRVRPGRWAVAMLVALALGLSARYALKPAFVTPEEDRAVVDAARAVQALTAEAEPVVTMHGTTFDLLYYCNHPGWAIAPDTQDLDAVLADRRREGARHLVVVGQRAPELRTPAVEGRGFAIFAIDGK